MEIGTGVRELIAVDQGVVCAVLRAVTESDCFVAGIVSGTALEGKSLGKRIYPT